jgi:hypothetical protein
MPLPAELDVGFAVVGIAVGVGEGVLPPITPTQTYVFAQRAAQSPPIAGFHE